MEKQVSFDQISKLTKIDNLSRQDLIQRNSILEGELARVIKENYELRNLKITDAQLQLILQEQLGELRNTIYGSSSERYKKSDRPKEPAGPPKPRVKKPSERYPQLPVVERVITMDPVPSCVCCQSVMEDSGMTEDSEQLTVIPKKYEIILQKRKKYRCSKCHGDIQTSPAPARIIEGSSYSDEMIQDVALSKYCDLIPLERYAAMAARCGVMDIPPHSLIELTHQYADFVIRAYYGLKHKVVLARILRADETPHKMLEGSETKSWFLWGFSTEKVCYLECHDTRSGDVASDVLMNSKCEVLVTDVYSGYGKAIKEVNKQRFEKKETLIKSGYCNAHARRYFFKARVNHPEAEFYLEQYHEIYKLNAQAKGKPPDQVLELRQSMKPYFKVMKDKALEDLVKYPEKNKFFKAMAYLINNYQGLTLFLEDAEVPIDNNAQERLLRSHVVGRKTWYGTHSERGAKTAAILFSLVESCKLNQVNPREYFEQLTKDLLQGKKAYTPDDFKKLSIPGPEGPV